MPQGASTASNSDTNTVYYPSMVCNFRIRFDEALSVNTSLPTPGTVPQGAAGAAAGNPQTGAGVSALVGQADKLSQILGIVPKNCSVELPGYRQAGKFNLEMDFRDLPLDPRVVRTCYIEFHLGAVPASDFADGMVSGYPNTVSGSGTPPKRRKSIIDTRDSAGAIRQDTLVMTGLVDNFTVEHTERGSMIHMEGRDLRGLLLDTYVTAAALAQLKLDQPINTIVEQILSIHPMLKYDPQTKQGVIVAVDSSEWPGQKIPSPGVAGNLTRVQLGSSGAKPMVHNQGDPQKLSFWDMITQYCYLVNTIPYFVGNVLRLRPATSLWDMKLNEVSFNPNVKTPFKDGQPRTLTTGQGAAQTKTPIKHRYMIYGRDILTLKFERKLGGTKVPSVQVVCVDTGSTARGKQRLLTATFPDDNPSGVQATKLKSSKVTSVSPSGQVTQQDVLRIPVHGISSKAQLMVLAQNIREEIGRNEVGGAISTKSLASFGGNNADPDLLRLRVGDAVELAVDASNLQSYPPVVSELNQQNSRGFEEQVKALTARIGDANLARVLVATSRGSVQELQRIFRVADIRYSWNAESGVAIDFDFSNYVEVRYDVINPGQGAATGGTATTTSSTATQQTNAQGVGSGS
jgi:hypothetical protein